MRVFYHSFLSFEDRIKGSLKLGFLKLFSQKNASIFTQYDF